ncbi:MAG: GNAT family N-acetyltransferase, partial [Candidatus Marinimicrobia bacterium]|nr:GNAT family N-acetyltransferase [Candidatus Neomarinimicrobiota bacterium]
MGDTLFLRPPVASDLELYYSFASDEKIAYLSDDRIFKCPEKKNYTKLFNKYVLASLVNYYPLVICRDSDGKAVGQIHAGRIDRDNRHAYVGFQIAEEFRRNGYALEALQIFIEHLFNDLKLNRIAAEVYEYNTASIALLQKAGFLQEGRMKHWIRRADGVYDKFIYALIKDNWEQDEGSVISLQETEQLCLLFGIPSDLENETGSDYINKWQEFYDKSECVLEKSGAEIIWYRENMGLACLAPRLKKNLNPLLDELKDLGIISVYEKEQVIIGAMGSPEIVSKG